MEDRWLSALISKREILRIFLGDGNASLAVHFKGVDHRCLWLDFLDSRIKGPRAKRV